MAESDLNKATCADWTATKTTFNELFFFVPESDSDGKLYDAYVAYSQPNTEGFSNEVEAFVLHTLPEVLEKACGYKLFIAGRDCMPGMGESPSWQKQHCSISYLMAGF